VGQDGPNPIERIADFPPSALPCHQIQKRGQPVNAEWIRNDEKFSESGTSQTPKALFRYIAQTKTFIYLGLLCFPLPPLPLSPSLGERMG
jgi:hypothetical protein